MNTKNMPPGLARYWKAHKKRARKAKSATAVRDPQHRKLVKSIRSHFAMDEAKLRVRRRVNPIAVFKIAIQKGTRRASRLYLARDDDKFTTKAKARTFSTLTAAKIEGRRLHKQYSAQLKHYTMLIVPLGNG